MPANGGSSETRANRVTGRNALNGNNHGNGLGGTTNVNIPTIEEMYTQYRFTMDDEDPPAPPSSLEEDTTFDSQFARGLVTLGAGAGNSERPNGLHNRSSQMQLGLARSGAQDGGCLTRPRGEASNGVHTYPARSQQVAGSPPDFPLPATPTHANRFASRDQAVPSVLPSSDSDQIAEAFGTTSLPEATPETETGNAGESVDTSRSTHTETYSGPALSDIMEDPTEDEFGEGSTDLSLNSSFTAQPLFTEGSVESGGQDSLQRVSTVDTQLVTDSNTEGHETAGTNLADQDQEWETTEEEEEVSGSQDQTVLNVQIPEVVLPSLPNDSPTLLSSRNIDRMWDRLSVQDNLSSPPGALLTDKLNTGSFLGTQRTKEKSTEFDIQPTDSWTDQELPSSQVWPESRFQATALCTQQATTSEKITTSTLAILLRNPVKVKDPIGNRTLKMPGSSAKSTDGSYTTSTEPFPDLNLTPEAASAESARLVDAAARIYAPEPRSPREFPNARLTIDRRHRILTDPQLVAAQDIVGRQLLIIGMLLYPFGGFLLINSMAEDGIYGHNAMMEVSKMMGLPVVGSVGTKHANMAKRIQSCMIWLGVAVMAGVVGVLAYALAA
ncbi:hypothetical protein DV736_g4265, partial [Chaetothyriales sp. CBS 134916]